MARVTYAPVTGKTVGQTVGASKPQPVTPKVATMKPTTSNPVGSMPYQPPGPATQPPSGGMPHPGPVPPTKVSPGGSGTVAEVALNHPGPVPPTKVSPPVGNPMPHPGPVPPTQTQPPAPQPSPFHPPPVPPTFEPPVRNGQWMGDAFTPGGGGFVGYGSPFKNFNPNEGVSPHVTPGSGIVSNPLPHPPPVPPNMQRRNPNDAYTPLPNIGFGGSKPPFVPLPPEVVNPDIGRIPPAQGGIVSNPLPNPPTMPPTMNPIPEPTLPPQNNPYGVIGQPLSGAPAVVPPGGYAPIPEPTLPVGYNPGGGVGGIATQPIGNPVAQPGGNSAPFPETPIKTNADRAELAPPPGSYTKFADRGKWSGQDAQAQRIANRRAKKNKGNANDATPETGNLVAPPAPKKKKAKKPAQVTQPESSNAGGTPEGNKNKKNKKDKKDKNAKVTKADKQKAKNRTPQPGTPARPYRSHGVTYRPLLYGGTLRI